MGDTSDALSQSEIDNLLNSLNVGTEGAGSTPEVETTTQNIVVDIPQVSLMEASADDKKSYKLYNFRRPDKFSKDHLKAIQDIHKEFSRQFALILSTYLRMNIEMDVVSTDQLTYDEFSRSMPNPIMICILELSPLPGQILLGVSYESVTSIVDRMLGGNGKNFSMVKELTDIEEALAKKILEKLTTTLAEAWKNIFPVKGNVIGIDDGYSRAQIATPGEIVALVTLEMQIGGRFSGLISICFPYPVLENVLGQLSSQHIIQTKGIATSVEDKQKILTKLNPSSLKVNVKLGDVDITVRELLDLKAGDVLRLNSSVEDNLVVNVNEISKFVAKVGTYNNKVAVCIDDIIKEDNSKEELEK